MRQQTTTIAYEKSRATGAHIDLTNTQKVRQIHQPQDFQYQLASKTLSQGSIARDSRQS